MRFIGSNDTATLDGVIEELEYEKWELQRRAAGLRSTPRNIREIASLTRVSDFIDRMISVFEDAKKNGPTPDLTKLRITVPEESRKALLGED